MRTGNASTLPPRARPPIGSAGSPGITPATARGFTYIAILIAVAIMGVVIAEAAVVWHTAQQRERERELLFVGDQFRLAIGRYYHARGATGAARQYPQRLEDLLRDPRFLGVARYLRKIYHDPITGSSEWGLVKTTGDRIIGVYSLSGLRPIKQKNFSTADQDFDGKDKYSEWTFVYQPTHPTLPTGQIPDSAQGSDADTSQSRQWSSTNY